ncbi:uncharacterized protein LOC117290119 [Asterias rubens]|uniref:uncharacterized protein LOC117290119 n=1 Tax=Asterias rubens TaxID=7604 RepID=UPI001454F7A5|nr:uncharacterized protein LOC117290119 [Asterias rubens]
MTNCSMNATSDDQLLSFSTGSTTPCDPGQDQDMDGELPYLTPVQVAVRVTTLSVICIVGVSFNTLNGLMLLKSKKPRSTMHVLMLNLVLADLTISLTCIPISILFEASNGNIYIPSGLCKFSGYLLQTLLIASLLTQSVISVIRTVAVTLSEALKQRLPKIAAYKIVIFVWLHGVLTPLLPLLSHDHGSEDLFIYHPRFIACTISDMHTTPMGGMVYGVAGFLLPLLIICISYIVLYFSLRRHLRKTLLVQDKCSRHMYAVQMRVHVKVGCLVMLVVSSVILIWVPFYIVSSLSLFDDVHVTALKRNASVWLIYGASSVNPIMYGFMNSSLRQEFRTYMGAKHPKVAEHFSRLSCCCCGRKRAKLDSVFVIPAKQLNTSCQDAAVKGSISGGQKVVVQINHEVSLKHQSVFSIENVVAEPSVVAAATKNQPNNPKVARDSVPPLVKRCSWSKSLANNARRLSDKVSRRRSGSEDLDGQALRQLPLLDLNAVTQLREESSHAPSPRDFWTLSGDELEFGSDEVFENNTEERLTKYHTLSVPSPSLTRHRLASGDGSSVVTVSTCIKTQPAYRDIVKVRRVFIEEVTFVAGLHGSSTLSTSEQVRYPAAMHTGEHVSSIGSQCGRTIAAAMDDVQDTMAMQLPGCIQTMAER